MLYELAARVDCWNLRRLATMDLFLMPVRNPDGRDAPPGGVRTSAWAFDHNRDFGTQNQVENKTFLPLLKRYPGLFYIDAHQTTSNYFFPPNEDPVHHEISDFTVDFITDMIGPAIRKEFDSQSIQYFNYDTYDLFVPEYGDTVPSLLSGAAGMTFEKGTSELYGKQVYEHYLAINATIDVTAQNKPSILHDWVEQWAEAVRQGEQCKLEPNELVSPLTEPLKQQPSYDVCGYFFRPDRHEGDTASLLKHMQAQGVHVYKFDTNVATAGVREFGTGTSGVQTLPQGTLYVPLDQPLKHWIQAVFGEVMTLLIALEFNHTLQYVVRREQSIIQTRVVLLIALLAVSRKLIVFDLHDIEAPEMLGLAAITIALAGAYWLVRDRDDRAGTKSEDPVE